VSEPRFHQQPFTKGRTCPPPRRLQFPHPGAFRAASFPLESERLSYPLRSESPVSRSNLSANPVFPKSLISYHSGPIFFSYFLSRPRSKRRNDRHFPPEKHLHGPPRPNPVDLSYVTFSAKEHVTVYFLLSHHRYADLKD